ncbi:N-acetylneuraminate lyase [Hyalella azteca]|uniref:N-acetylneuraminate lyase n=1 Tax=Hyalella azteca TaxID=294128 RepID=A0A8B7PAB0_HYAAZ|nr:N-acetylneuraminate lyase [Hyalella azteca]XP_047739966.1 N-acetylneuraminate lyase [Hyalella azteca]XP_047739969.1 N-acetylneuraminate lyase [Hyalella azteca]
MTLIKKKFEFQGMMAPTFAPFNEDGSLNTSLISHYAQLLHDGGVKGVFVNGCLGEGYSMTSDERMEVAEAWAKCSDMVGCIVVQVGGASIKDAQILARHAESLGVSGIALLPPVYDRPATVAQLVDYCRDVASAAPNTPFLYYHYPLKTSVNLPMDEFLEVGAASIPTLVGMKFTSLDVEGEGKRCQFAVNGVMNILPGFDETLTTARKLNFSGAINGVFNFMPLEAGRLFCLAGLPADSDCCIPKEKRDGLIECLQARINVPWKIVIDTCGHFSVSGAKHVMTQLTGINVGPARRPQVPLTTDQAKAIAEGIQKLGFVCCKERCRKTSETVIKC